MLDAVSIDGTTGMNSKLLVSAALLSALFLITPTADARGCLKGAAVGGVAGHLAHHHAVAGAAIGCAVGHYRAHHHHHVRAHQ